MITSDSIRARVDLLLYDHVNNRALADLFLACTFPLITTSMWFKYTCLNTCNVLLIHWLFRLLLQWNNDCCGCESGITAQPCPSFPDPEGHFMQTNLQWWPLRLFLIQRWLLWYHKNGKWDLSGEVLDASHDSLHFSSSATTWCMRTRSAIITTATLTRGQVECHQQTQRTGETFRNSDVLWPDLDMLFSQANYFMLLHGQRDKGCFLWL